MPLNKETKPNYQSSSLATTPLYWKWVQLAINVNLKKKYCRKENVFSFKFRMVSFQYCSFSLKQIWDYEIL